MKTEFLAKASRLVGRAGLQIKKHTPEILVISGVVGTVASTVLACKATTKANEIIKEEVKPQLEVIHKGMEDGYIENKNGKQEYTEEDGKKDLTIVYTQTGVKMLKVYGPAIAVGTLSIASILTGCHIFKKRNLALAAAYAVVDKGFKDYRKNVVERFGEAIDKELRYNIKAKEVEEIVVDKDGNETVEKTIINVPDLNVSEYARFFDDGNTGWTKDPEYNLMYLRRQQDYANEMLRTKGHVFLNEIYDMLGIKRSEAGQMVGWIYDENNPNGDNFIDFGIYRNTQANRNFVNGYERTILLDFNVDGPIYNLIER